jgi:hypothetical protein
MCRFGLVAGPSLDCKARGSIAGVGQTFDLRHHRFQFSALPNWIWRFTHAKQITVSHRHYASQACVERGFPNLQMLILSRDHFEAISSQFWCQAVTSFIVVEVSNDMYVKL